MKKKEVRKTFPPGTVRKPQRYPFSRQSLPVFLNQNL